MCYQLTTHLTEGSLEVKLPTIWTNGKAEVGRVKEEKSRREKIREEKKSRRKKMQVREKVGMSRITVIFCKTCDPPSKSRLPLKRPVRSHLASCKMKNCTTLWPEAHLEVKMYKARHDWSTFGSWDVEKVHAVVAQSTFGSQNVQSTPCSDHFSKLRCQKKCTPLWHEAYFQVKMWKAHQGRNTFGSWHVEKVHDVAARSTFGSQNVPSTPFSDRFRKLRCRKSARRCGTKLISKSKCGNNNRVGILLEVDMSKKWTLLWREAHFQVKMHKAHHSRTAFVSWDIEKVHTLVARSKFPSQNVETTPCSEHFSKLRCRKSARPCGTKLISKSKCGNHTMPGTLLEVEMVKKCTPGARSTFPNQKLKKVSKTCGLCSNFNNNHNTTLRYIQFHYATLQLQKQLQLHYITLHLLHSTTLQLRYTTVHYIILHYTNYNYNCDHTTLHYTTLIKLDYTTLHSTSLHSITLHYTTLHYTTLQLQLELQLQLQLQLHYTTLHHATPHYTNYNYKNNSYTTPITLHYATLITLHSTPLHSTTVHSTTLTTTTPHNATPHYTTTLH